MNIDKEGLAKGETANLKLEFSREDTKAEASMVVSVSFEGDWSELYGGEEEEGWVRQEVAQELFGLVLDKMK